MSASETAVGAGEAAAIARELYGIEGTATPLPGELDLNFRLRNADGTSYVLKLHNPAADPDELELQDAALLHIAGKPDAPPAPRVVLTSDGRPEGRVETGDGLRIVRLLSWLEGSPWLHAGPHDDLARADLGRHVALLDAALADFSHPVMRRELLWNLTNAPKVAEWQELVAEPARRLVAPIFERYAEVVAPLLDELPHQLIHNDANELNVLVAEDGLVGGIIDFGDIVWSPRVCGLAVAGAYAMQGHSDPVQAVVPLVYGYDQASPLGVDELAVVFDLMRTRLAMSVCMAAYQHANDPGNDYLLVSQEGVEEALRQLAAESPDLAHFRFRDACGYEPNPHARAVRQHFESGAARPQPVLDAGVTAGGRGALDLGLDLVAPAGSSVLAPLAGTVAATAPAEHGGGAVLIEHRTAGDIPFWTLFRHLSRDSADALEVGATVLAGERIGVLGTPDDGQPRLGLQLLTSLVGMGTHVPSVAPPDEADLWRSISPDPNLLAGLPVGDEARAPHPSDEIAHLRTTNLSLALSLSYSQPIHIVRGEGAYLYDDEGRQWLDLVNNVAHVGHCHPRVVEAGRRQMALLNTNTRYLHDSVVSYARRLVCTLPDPLRVVLFVNSGSEANDLALRLAIAHTERRDVLVLDHAYHGHLSSQVDLSPYKFNRPGGRGRPEHTHVCELPDPYRGRLRDEQATGEGYAADVHAKLAALRDGPAAFFAESLQGCGGQIVYPDGYLAEAFAAVREAGGVCVVDEVQVGFGRVGSRFWGFELQGVTPDVVTMGKPMGNGHPVAAVATTPQIAASFVTGMEYFNTFGGNPVSAEIGVAVLDVMRDERLQAHAGEMGKMLIDGLRELGERHALIGDVRGHGLFIGVELTTDRDTRAPATSEAERVKEAVKARGVLISTDGPDDNVLKIKPPLVLSADDCAFFVESLDAALTEVAQHS